MTTNVIDPELRTMTDLEIAKRVRQEHERLKQITIELRKAADRLPKADTIEWLGTLRSRFEHFRAHMYYRIALEEEGGFLKEVLVRRPTLSKDVEHCRSEQREILGLIEAIKADLHALKPHDAEAIKDVQFRILHILSELTHLEEHESLLLLFVFNTEIGGEGG